MYKSPTKTIVIDGNNFDDLKGFCEEIHTKLCPAIPFNGSLDAFNDILRGGFNVFEYDEPINLIWENSAKSKIDLGYDAAANYFESQLPYVHPSNIKGARQRIEDARQKRGKTLFDQYVGMIRLHMHINFELG